MTVNSFENKRSRLGIFYLYDVNGEVDCCVEKLLGSMKRYLQELYIIVGGRLTVEGRKRLSVFTDIIYVAQNALECNSGYQKAVQCFGTELLGEYDEVIFFNNSLMGPIYDLNGLFQEMDRERTDFWGILPRYGESETLPLWFISFRQKLVRSVEFRNYWKMDWLTNEITLYFSEKGFQWKAYIQAEEVKTLNEEPLLFYPREILGKYHCPFFLRESFCTPYRNFIDQSVGQASLELFHYLQENDLYDMDMLWDWMLKTEHQSDIVRNLHLTFILPEKASLVSGRKEIQEKRRIAMIIHIYRTDMAEELAACALRMPSWTDVYITTDTSKKKEEIKSVFEKAEVKHFEIRLIQNRGRDVSSKLVAMKDVIMEYDYVCCIHDKKTPHLKPQSIGDSFGYKCFKNIIPSAEYVNNVIDLFEKQPRMGIAVPPEPNHAVFFTTLGLEWVGNFDNAKKLADKIGLNVPFSQEKEPVAPFGSFFWFRPRALKKLYDLDWNYEDFPVEPIADDGTILHAIERIYPFVAQDAGYFPAVIMSDEFARMEHTNLKYYVQQYNKLLIKNGIINKQSAMCDTLEDILDTH